MANGQIRLKRRPNSYAPTLLREGERFRPMSERRAPQFSMPPAPMERIQPPVYEEPEDMGWKKAALGIALSGAAGLIGQGPQTAHNYFTAPRIRAQEDYAREYGAYQNNASQWEQYYDRIAQQQGLQMEGQKLDEMRRSNMSDENERMTRPFPLSYGGMADRSGRTLIESPYAQGGRTQDERDRRRANEMYAENRPGVDPEQLSAIQQEEAWREFQTYHGGVPAVGVLTPEGRYESRPRYEAYGQERPIDFFEDPTATAGRARTRPPRPVVNEEDIARAESSAADQKRRLELERRNKKTDWTWNAMNDEMKKQYDADIDAAIKAVDDELKSTLQRLRSGTTGPLGSRGGKARYDPSTDSVVYE
jgi:hypothetical protein